MTVNNTALDWDYDAIYVDTREYLIPYIEKHYNVFKEAKDRAYAGLSAGGMTTTELYIREPGLFGYYGSFSGSSVFDFPVLDDYTDYKEPQLYLSAGYEDGSLQSKRSYQSDSDRTTQGFADRMDELGIEYNGDNGIFIPEGGTTGLTGRR